MKTPREHPTAIAARLADLFQSLANEYRAISEISVDGIAGQPPEATTSEVAGVARELFRDDCVASWGTDEPADDFRFVTASEALKARGTHGWVFGTLAGHRLDGLRVVRTHGRYVAEFPNLGLSAPVAGGSVSSDHDLGEQVIAELRRRGALP